MKTIVIPAAFAFLLLTSCKPETTDTTSSVPAVVDGAYPLTTCPVSGEKLGGMGAPYVFVHEGITIKLCCKACLKDFDKEPAKYIGMVKQPETK